MTQAKIILFVLVAVVFFIGTNCEQDCECDNCGCADGGGDTDAGLAGCFDGSHTIQNSFDAEFIAPYTCIIDDLTINAPGLASLDLPNLKTIGGNLTVRETDLQDLDGLTNLESVGGYVGIFSNDLLQNLDGLSSLQTVGGNLSIKENVSLTCNPAALEAQIDVAGTTTICENAPGDGCGADVCAGVSDAGM